MNNNAKLTSLLMILPLFAVILVTNFQDADAVKSQGKNAPGRLGTDSYGSKNANKVCGDKLCSEIKQDAMMEKKKDTMMEKKK